MMTYDLNYIDSMSRQEMSDSFNRDYLLDKPLNYTSIQGAVITSKGISVSCKGGGGISACLSGKYVYLGEWLGIWGHCITDNLKKLWIVDRLKNNPDGVEYKLCAAKRVRGDYPDNFKLLLDRIGIRWEDITFIEEPTSVENLIIPDDSIVVNGNSRYYYKEFSELINRIRDDIPKNLASPDKIYFTRTRIKKKKRDFGEKAIEDTFRKLGFEIYSPEKLTLDQQLSLLRNCRHFACTEGSIAHNVVFCSDGVNIDIIRKVNGLISYQFTLMDIRNAHATYIDTGLTPWYVFAFWSGPFLLCVRDNLINFAYDFAGLQLKPYLSKSDLLKYFRLLIYKSLRGRTIPTKCRNFLFYKNKLSQLLWNRHN